MKRFLALMLLLPAILFGTELQPWLDKELQIHARASTLLQFYQTIYTPHTNIHHQARDRFYDFSATLAAFGMGAEIEILFADTKKQHFDVDCFRLTGRYVFMSDVIGKPLTITGGLTVTQAFRHSIYDISSFHHGHVEAEASVAFGKEVPCRQFWDSRWWTYLGLGVADGHAAPWFHGFFAWEKNWCDQQQFRVFLESLIGFGGRNISQCKKFHGYGNIKHRSLDVGARYSYFFDYGISLSLQYAYRAYALNFPTHANLVLVTFLYPIGF